MVVLLEKAGLRQRYRITESELQTSRNIKLEIDSHRKQNTSLSFISYLCHY